jgi:hypothetical protein
MLSQDSLKHYVEDAEKETLMERKRLVQREHERRQFANKIINKSVGPETVKNGANVPFENNALSTIRQTKKTFGKFTDGSSKKDRLQDLLEKTEQYTKFILQ